MAFSEKSAVTDRGAQERRYLAANVVCLFADDRPVLPKVRKRGRYCGNVLPIWSLTRLRPGDVAELCRGALPENHGKRVRLVEVVVRNGLPAGEWWSVEALSWPLATHDPNIADPGGKGWAMKCLCLASNLRRVKGVAHG